MTGEKMDGKSFDNRAARIAALKDMFPEAVREGRFDLDALNSLLEDAEEIYALNEERYEFNWAGKADSLKQAQRRSNGTLRPVQEESKDWETTGNLYPEGDNLEVMKLLQQGYLRKVKMIYIDPPYNTGNDFVYEDDFSDPIAKYKDATGQGMRANPETAGRYHSRWLSMMYPRLKIAKTLLRDDGVIFISIDDLELHNLRKLCDDTFGEENFIGSFIWKSRQNVDSRNKTNFSNDHEYIVVYARRIESFSLRGADIDLGKYSNPDNDPRGPWMSNSMLGLANAVQRPNLHYSLVDPTTGLSYPCPPDTGWRYSRETMQDKIQDRRVIFPAKPDGRPREKKYQNELANHFTGISSILGEDVGYTFNGSREVRDILEGKHFDFPKPVSLLSEFIRQSTEKDSLLLDFFSGSGTLAHAMMQLNADDGGNRKFICVQITEPVAEGSEAAKAGFKTIADIGKERIRRAGEKILAEWKEKNAGRLPLDGDAPTPPDVGFRVFRLDSSNWKPWDDSWVDPDSPEAVALFAQRMDDSLDDVVPGRREIDLVYEVCLKYGVPLTEKITTLEAGGKRFYVIGARGHIFLCLEKEMTSEAVEAVIAQGHAIGVMIFSDQSFSSVNEMTNAGLALEKANIEYRLI